MSNEAPVGGYYRALLRGGPLDGHIVKVESDNVRLQIELPVPGTFAQSLYKSAGTGEQTSLSYVHHYDHIGGSIQSGPRNP
ncbi:hypothetical protein [Microbacterium mangrovi]|uniref:hypothetical protein n=1 Tax=Microbacterium mangrovi TaxID=1348253 RepID=UPI0012E01EDF|nr:hypothetical protein [Microbacterium mangrovi]